MDDPQTLIRWLALQAVPGLGPVKASRLLARYPIEQLFELDANELLEIGLKPAQVDAIRQPNQRCIDVCLNWLQQPHRHIFYLTHPAYPSLLAEIPAAPLVIFVEGDPTCLSRPQIAIVGTRHPTFYGKEKARQFAAELSEKGMVITSGLALGVDAASHQGALEAGGQTLAVMGTGLAQVYPARHRKLAEKIVENGALISELWPNTAAIAANFPRRNRIISGLALGVFVVEAALKSGSLITARYALEQGRDVFALPGSIDNVMTQGCHQLIKQGAKLCEMAVDIEEEVETLAACTRNEQLNLFTAKPQSQQLPFSGLLDSVGFEATAIDMVAMRSGLPIEEVLTQLVELELQGWVAAVPGGYIRLRRD